MKFVQMINSEDQFPADYADLPADHADRLLLAMQIT